MADYSKNEGKTLYPTFRIYHPKQDNSGTAMAARVVPASLERQGYLQLEFAYQTEVGNGDSVFPRFGWKDRLTIRMNLPEVAMFISFLQGDLETWNTVLQKKDVEVVFDVSHKAGGDTWELSARLSDKEHSRNIDLSMSKAETMALRMALQSVMGVLAFGIR